MSTDFDFRALCAELLPPLAKYDAANPYHDHRDLIARALAALAPQGRVTMGEDDFELIAKNGERVVEIADAAIEAMRLSKRIASIAASALGPWVDGSGSRGDPQRRCFVTRSTASGLISPKNKPAPRLRHS